MFPFLFCLYNDKPIFFSENGAHVIMINQFFLGAHVFKDLT